MFEQYNKFKNNFTELVNSTFEFPASWKESKLY